MGAPMSSSWRRHALLGTTALLLITSGVGGLPRPAHADFNEGTAAYQAGDYTRAYNEWLPLARAGNAAAQRNIGQLYRLGLGVPKDLKVAANWYRLAAEQGLARAQANLGVMYLRGEGVERDPQTAASWFRKAAEQGHAISQYNLALMLEQGYGVSRDRSRAATWFERAAEGGHDKAGERLAALLSEAVVPAAGESEKPAPAQPIQTARSQEYIPERIRNRGAAPPPSRPASETVAPNQQVASAEPREQRRPDRLTEALTAPPSPADLAGTPAARFAVQPETRAPRQVARLPDTAPEANSLSRPAFLRSARPETREDKPVDVALAAPSSPIPARRAPTPSAAAPAPAPKAQLPSSPIIEVPVAPFLKREAAATQTPTRTETPPTPRRETATDQRDTAMPSSPAVPIPPVQVAAITAPPEPRPAPRTEAEPAALNVPSPSRVKPVPDFLQREAMAPPPDLALERNYGPNSYLAPRSVPVVLRLDGVPRPAPRREIPESPAAVAAPLREAPVPPAPRDTPAFLVREAEQDTPAPADMPRERKAPVQVAALPVVPRPDAPAEATQTEETKTESPFGSRIPLFYVRQAEALAAAARAEMTQVAALAALPAAPGDKPVPTFLREEAASSAELEQIALVVEPKPAPDFLKQEARAVDPEERAPIRLPAEKPTPPFLREEVRLEEEPAPASPVEEAQIESEDDAPVQMAALSQREAPAFLAEEAKAVEAPAFLQREAALSARAPAPEPVPAAPVPSETPLAATAAKAEPSADDAVPAPQFLRDEALTGALAFVDTPRAGDPVGRAKRVTALLDDADETARTQASHNVPRYYRDRAALVAELEKADDDVAPLPFLRRAPRAAAGAPTQPVPEMLVAEARRASAPVAGFLREEADVTARRRAVPGTGETPEARVAVRGDTRAPATPPVRESYRETTEDRRAVDAGVAAYLGRDYDKAQGFWQPAADRGNPDAQFFIGGLYLDGNGVDRDLIAAHVWFARAADRGHARAADQLALLRKIMTQDQYAEAERRRAAR